MKRNKRNPKSIRILMDVKKRCGYVNKNGI